MCPLMKNGQYLQIIWGGKEKAGAKMKSKIEWPNDGIGTNSSGFSGLPGAGRFSMEHFDQLGLRGYWWSSTEVYSSSAWVRSVVYDNNEVNRDSEHKESGLSVRCLRD